MNPIFRHDWLLFRNGFMHAFSRTRDRLLLLATGAVMIAALIQTMAHPPHIAALIPVGFMALVAATTQHAGMVHLNRLATHSVLVGPALNPVWRKQAMLARHGLTFGACLLLLALFRPPGAVWACLVYLPGTMLARIRPTVGRSLPRRPATSITILPPARSLGDICLRSQTGLTRRQGRRATLSAAVVLTAGTPFALAPIVPDDGATVTMLAIATVLLARLTRVDGATIRFATSSGITSARIIRAHLPGPAGFLLPVILLLLAVRPSAAGNILLLGLIFLWIMLARILARCRQDDRSADRQLMLAAVACAALAPLLKFLTPLVLLGYTVWLARRARDSLWTLP